MGKKEDRFICVYSEASFTLGVLRVLVDRETGVNYLWCREGGGGGLTPLLWSDGKPVITPKDALQED
ncbi:MAG: xylan 1,4-beta-xylosidase [Oscillospiraceae bacterium]|jgi:hypothetical protein|nr:xylan 1,4-beta-xylosidase [Oscillospiraceae bacterium]